MRELSGKRAPPDTGGASSPSVTAELYPIGGFAQLTPSLPPRGKTVERQWSTGTVERNGLNPAFADSSRDVHCLAAEPNYTLLRISVADDGQEVAYETAVLGTLRTGIRCFELRSAKYGTRIELCTLLVEVLSIGEEPYEAATLQAATATHHITAALIFRSPTRSPPLPCRRSSGRCGSSRRSSRSCGARSAGTRSSSARLARRRR